MITREHYIKQARGFYDSDLIKIITGIRRSGKSIILNQIMSEIQSAHHTIYLNFEDERTISQIPDAAHLIQYIDTHRGSSDRCYLFFDEIQEVKDWPLACKTLRLDGHSLFITGSNSKLLSREFTQSFSGRYVSFRVAPFVYKEIVAYSKELGKEPSISDYLIWGGFPKRFEFDSGADQLQYLTDLTRSIIENDLIIRYQIHNIDLFRRLVAYVSRSNSRIFSARSIEAYLRNEHIDGSINTVLKYLDYLEEAYIIERIRPFSTRAKAELSYYFKLYDTDVAFNSIRVTDGRYDLTHNLENIVYNELIYMGYHLEVYNDEKSEIDFIATKDGKKYYIQVAYSVVDEKAYSRELSAFSSVNTQDQKILITNDEIDYSTSTIRHLRLKDFLLLESLETF